MNSWTICRTKFEAESPAVLFINRYGNKRVLCEACEKLLDTATMEEETPERSAAKEALTALAAQMKDPEAIEMLGAVLSGEERAEDNVFAPEEEAEIEAMLEEAEKEEEDAPRSSALDYIIPIVFGAAFLLFLAWMYLF